MANPVFKYAGVDIDTQGIASIEIQGAGSMNLLGTPVILDLIDAMEYLQAQKQIQTLIFRGSGDRAFVAGADVKEMGSLGVESAKAFIDNLRRLYETIRYFPTPVIARIPGWALGGGLELALACDIRVASSSAMLGMPEIKFGIPSIIHAALLPRLIGDARAAWLLLTGENVNASQALAWGLVDDVVAPTELDAEVSRIAHLFAGYGPQVVRQQKRLLREWQQEPLDTSLLNGVQEFGGAFATGEPQDFMSRFARKGK